LIVDWHGENEDIVDNGQCENAEHWSARLKSFDKFKYEFTIFSNDAYVNSLTLAQVHKKQAFICNL
jgi:hypothetical protein